MTLSITFYDDIKYDRLDFINRDLDFIGNGLVNTTDFPITYPATPNMTLQLGAGTAWVDGYRIHNDSNLIPPLTIPTADPSYPRIDIIQIGHDDINSTYSLVVKKGVAAASPVEPGADPGYFKLYAISVAANVTSITSANVTDRRALVPLNVSGTQISMAGALSNSPGAVTDSNIGNRTADPTQVPTGLTGTITNWLSWIVNRIKAITGKANWYDAPDTTLTAASQHISNTNNPHNVTAAQVGAASAKASVNDHLLPDTTMDTVATYTPTAQHNYMIGVYLRIVTAATDVTCQVTYADATGAQTNQFFPLTNLAVESGETLMVFINAVSGTPINVQVQAGTANQVYASASIVEV